MLDSEQERIGKLPLWAQNLIRKQRDENQKLRTALDTYRNAGKKTRVRVLDVVDHDNDVYLPENKPIRFAFGEETYVDVKLKDGVVQVMSDGFRSDMVIRPQVTNVVEIILQERFNRSKNK